MYIFAEKHAFISWLYGFFLSILFQIFKKNHPYFMPSYLKEVYITAWNIIKYFKLVLFIY